MLTFIHLWHGKAYKIGNVCLICFFQGRQELNCSFAELRSASESAAQLVHTMCYIKNKILLGEYHHLKLRGVGPPARGDYDVYLVRCKFLSSFHRCKLDIKKLASMTSVSRSSWYHCNYKGILVVSKNQNLKEFSYLNKGLFFFHIEDLVTLVFMKLYSLYSSWWVDRKLN